MPRDNNLQKDRPQPENAGGNIPLTNSPCQEAGKTIGRYRLVERIGKGGFGTVWLANQEEPVRRRVAVKFPKVGMNTRDIITRFEGERQALARMQHPNIAQVLDAGATEDGQPYFVMEYVPGPPLIEYCQTNRIPLQKRLELFTQVCSAIQHAHQKGVIHRDLKPGNILILEEPHPDGAKIIPKVIDFGVAKALTNPLTDRTLYTGIGQLVGTPVYMSPEQANIGGGGVDTRSDIYSLGVMLYELLTGYLPFDESAFKKASLGEIHRILHEVDPPRPSARIRAGRQDKDLPGPDQWEALDTDFKSLERTLRSDLDWVVMKCLEKDPSRRYETAHGLALDIERFLNNEPLEAGPPGNLYRISKYIGKHRTGFAACMFILLTLVLGFAGMTAGLMQAQKAQAAEEAQRKTAEQRAAELLVVTEFQQSVFDRLQPEQIGASIFRSIIKRYAQILDAEDLPREKRESRLEALREKLYLLNPTDMARETFNNVVLEQSSRAISEEFAGQPLVEASLRESLGRAYSNIGLPLRARSEQQQAIDLRIRHQGNFSPETLLAMIAQVDFLLQGKLYPAAEELAQSLLDRVMGNPALPEDILPRVLLALGRSEYRNENWDRAEAHLEEAQARFRKSLGDSHPLALEAELEAIQALRHFDYTVGYNSRLIGGEMGDIALELHPRFEEAVAKVVRELGDDHPLSWRARQYYADSLALMPWASIPENAVNDLQNEWIRKSKAQLEKVLASQEKVLGALHPTTLQTRKTLLFLGTRVEMTPEERRAEVDALEFILETEISIWGENHPSVVDTLSRLAGKLDDYSLPYESIDTTRRAIRIQQRIEPGPSIDLADLYLSLSDRLVYQHHYEEALEAGKSALQIAESLEVPGGKMKRYRAYYVQQLQAVGRLREAERLIKEWDLQSFADVNLLLQGRWEEVLQRVQEWVAKKEAEGGIPIDYRRAWNYGLWGQRFLVRDMPEEAEFWGEQSRKCWALAGSGDSPGISPAKVDDPDHLDPNDREKARMAAHSAAEAFEAGKDEWMKRPPDFWERSRQFPYGTVNPYFAEETFLLNAAVLWEKAGQPEKADQYLKKYFAFRERIQSNGDPELLAWYEDIVHSEFGNRSLWDTVPLLTGKGYYQEAEYLLLRVWENPPWRWWMDPEGKRMKYREIMKFYEDWHAVDPEGGHLKKRAPWQGRIDEIDAEYARWRALKTNEEAG